MKAKWWWRLIDLAVNTTAFYLLYDWFGWKAAAIGVVMALWNFIDGRLLRG